MPKHTVSVTAEVTINGVTERFTVTGETERNPYHLARDLSRANQCDISAWCFDHAAAFFGNSSRQVQ